MTDECSVHNSVHAKVEDEADRETSQRRPAHEEDAQRYDAAFYDHGTMRMSCVLSQHPVVIR